MRQGDKELLKKEDSHIVGRKYVVAITQNYTFIAPYKKSVMDKKFKDRCRKLKIPKKLRAYLSTDTLAFELVSSVL
jgi:tRNA(Ile)-lysidine synthase